MSTELVVFRGQGALAVKPTRRTSHEIRESGAPDQAEMARTDHRLPGVSYSHSMVPGGLLVMSRVTRLTSATSLVMRVEIFSSRSNGRRAQSAVIASSEVTGRRTTGWP